MLEQGVGHSAWRAKYPARDWVTHERRQLANGDWLVLLREPASAMSAVLTFFHKNDDLHWVIHIHDYHPKAEKMFNLLIEEAEHHPWPAVSYQTNPLFGRF